MGEVRGETASPSCRIDAVIVSRGCDQASAVASAGAISVAVAEAMCYMAQTGR